MLMNQSLVINKQDLVSSPSAVASPTGTSQLPLSLFKNPFPRQFCLQELGLKKSRLPTLRVIPEKTFLNPRGHSTSYPSLASPTGLLRISPHECHMVIPYRCVPSGGGLEVGKREEERGV